MGDHPSKQTGRPRSKNKKTHRLVANATEAEVENFEKACAAVKLPPADTQRRLAEAFVEYVAQHGRVVWPLTFEPPPKKKH